MSGGDDATIERGDVARGAALAALSRGGALIEVIAQPIYTWLFGLATYGLYIVLWAAVNIAAKLVDLSLTEALQRIVPARDEAAAHGAVRFALLVTVIPAGLIALGVTIAAEPIAGLLSAAPEDAARLPLIVALFAWALPLWTLIEVATAAARARRAFGPEIRLRIFWEQLARLAFASLFFLAGMTSIGLMLAHLASLALVAVLALKLLTRYYDVALLRSAPLPTGLKRELIASGLALMPSALARRMLNDLPPIILNLMLPGARGATAAGLFGIARKVASIPLIVRQAFLYVLAPLSAAQAARDREMIAPLYRFSARVSVALAIPIGGLLALTGLDILGLFAPGAEAALPILLILIVGRVGEAIVGPATPIVEMTGHRALPLVNSAAGIALWALVAWLLVPEMGERGMAIAVAAGAIAIAWMATLALAASDRLWPFDAHYLRGASVGLAGVALLAAIGAALEPGGAAMRAVALVTLFPAIVWLTIRFGLDEADRAALGGVGLALRLAGHRRENGQAGR